MDIMLILTDGYIGGKYSRHFLSNFFEWKTCHPFSWFKSSKKVFKKGPDC